MSEMMKKVKAIPLGDISSFLAKNKYNEVECSEYQLGKEYTKVDIDSITDSFSGKIIGKKKTLMNADTSPVLDEDTITFGVKNGKTSEAKLFKRRVDSANGYTYLQNVIDEEDVVYKTKVVLDENENISTLSINTFENNGDIVNEEIIFENNGNINYKIKSTGLNKSSNYESEVRFENGKYIPIASPDTISELEDCHITMYYVLESLKEGTYGFEYNEQQKKFAEEAFQTLINVSPFKLVEVDEFIRENRGLK